MTIDVTKIKDETVKRAVYEIDSGGVALASPNLGAATATSINKVAITAPASSATLTIANGKTLTASKTITLTSADDTSVATLPVGATSLAPLTSPTFVTPVLGVATATSINKVAVTAPATSATLTIADGKTLTASKTITLTSADDTSVATLPVGATSLAPLVSPSFTTPTLGVATATSVNKVTITAPATSSTLTVADGKTLTASNTVTLAGADDTAAVTFQAGAQTVSDTKVRASTAVLTKNANTTFAIIPGLTVSLLAGKTYVIKGHLTITASNAAAGIKVAIATPDTLTLTSGTMTGLNLNDATPNATTTATALATAFGHATAAVTDVFFEGSIVVNAAGTLEIHAAQNASNASDMTVGVGSTLTVIRVS